MPPQADLRRCPKFIGLRSLIVKDQWYKKGRLFRADGRSDGRGSLATGFRPELAR